MKNISKILVPTDFSIPSEDAYNFAVQLAEFFNAELCVLNVYSDEFVAPTPHAIRGTLLEERKEEAIHKLMSFTQKEPPNLPAEVLPTALANTHTYVRKGNAGIEIVHFANREDIDLIIMGTRGEHNLRDKILGSVTTYVMGNSNVPVLVVPENTEYNDFMNILYADDLNDFQMQDLEMIQCWTNKFHADLHWVHVEVDSDEDYKVKRSEFERIVQINAPDLLVAFNEVESISVTVGLQEYADRNNIDLIVMHARKKITSG